jgi:hypothetical protein
MFLQSDIIQEYTFCTSDRLVDLIVHNVTGSVDMQILTWRVERLESGEKMLQLSIELSASR